MSNSPTPSVNGLAIPVRQIFPGEDLEQDIINAGHLISQWRDGKGYYCYSTRGDGAQAGPPYKALHHTRLGAVRLVAELMREAGVL